MSIEGLDAVIMTDYDDISLSTKIFRHSYLARERSVYRIACLQWNINSLMTTTAAHAELASWMDRSLERAMELIQTVHKPYGPLLRKILLLYTIWV